MRAYRPLFLAGMLMATLGLSACDMSTPSQVLTGKIRVKSQMVTNTLDARQVDPSRISSIADNFSRSGKGGMSLTVSYLTGARAREAAAERQGDVYRKAFKKLGVTNVSVVTVPVSDAQYADKVVVAYKGLVSLPPKGCLHTPGVDGAESLDDGVEQYQFGCGTEEAVSQMVVDPSDLMGHSGVQVGDSRRNGIVIDSYKSGTPNQPMKGYSASDMGTK